MCKADLQIAGQCKKCQDARQSVSKTAVKIAVWVGAAGGIIIEHSVGRVPRRRGLFAGDEGHQCVGYVCQGHLGRRFAMSAEQIGTHPTKSGDDIEIAGTYTGSGVEARRHRHHLRRYSAVEGGKQPAVTGSAARELSGRKRESANAGEQSRSGGGPAVQHS